MPEENMAEETGSPAVTDVNVESSSTTDTAESGQPAEGTAQKPAESVPFNQHPDWIAYRERSEAKILAAEERANRIERMLMERSSEKKEAQEDDPLANETEEAKDWYKRKIIPLAKKAALEIAAEERKAYMEKIKFLESQVGELTVGDFLRRYPDVKRGSEEAKEIVNKMRNGYSPDDAYAAVMFPKMKDQAAREKQEREKSTIQRKAAANVETKTIPPNAPVLNKGKSTDEVMDDIAKQLGVSFP